MQTTFASALKYIISMSYERIKMPYMHAARGSINSIYDGTHFAPELAIVSAHSLGSNISAFIIGAKSEYLRSGG